MYIRSPKVFQSSMLKIKYLEIINIIGISNEKLNKCHNFITIKTSKMHSIFCQII
jgi:hypothetical protein